MTVSPEQMAAYEAEDAARSRLPIYLGSFDDATCAKEIIAKAAAAGDESVDAGRQSDRYPYMCGYLQAELQRVCAQLHELQHRPGEKKARATRKRLFREAMSRRAA